MEKDKTNTDQEKKPSLPVSDDLPKTDDDTSNGDDNVQLGFPIEPELRKYQQGRILK